MKQDAWKRGSEARIPARTLRQGCLTSPIPFNVDHQAVMRQVEVQRRRMNEASIVVWKIIPGGPFAGKCVRGR